MKTSIILPLRSVSTSFPDSEIYFNSRAALFFLVPRRALGHLQALKMDKSLQTIVLYHHKYNSLPARTILNFLASPILFIIFFDDGNMVKYLVLCIIEMKDFLRTMQDHTEINKILRKVFVLESKMCIICILQYEYRKLSSLILLLHQRRF